MNTIKTFPRRKRAGRVVLLLAVAALVASGFRETEAGSDLVDDARATLEQWVETRRLISQERRDWTLGREMLTDRIDVVQREIESLRETIVTAEAGVTDTGEKRGELDAENERYQEVSRGLLDTIGALEARTAALLPRLPEPIRERVRPLSQRFPENPDETDLSLSERFMNVVGVLNAVNKFNREITVTSEVRTLSGGATAEVTAVYVGIGHGYYVSGDGLAAGVGTATSDAWGWTPAAGAAAEIARAISILENEEVAGFVKLPVWID